MARTAGARNADYAESRLALARRVREALIESDGIRLSLRELARHADTSVATLKYYFKDRRELLVGVMETLAIDGAPHLARTSLPVSGDVRHSLRHLLTSLAEAWVKFRVGRMHGAMLAEGLSQQTLGPSYVTLMLEPMLQMGEQVLQRFIDAGALEPCDVRQASLTLLSPVVFGLLHQDNLEGAKCRPLDLPGFIDAHVDAFLRAFPVKTARRRN